MSTSFAWSETHKIADEEISWVGECPWTEELCFGTESGRLVMPRNNGRSDVLGPVTMEMINDVAFTGDWVAISSRNEVVVFNRRSSRGYPFDGGAHGVVATSSEGFVAPLGVNGMLVVTTGKDGSAAMKTGLIPDSAFNYYKVVRLARTGATDYFLCAARTGGLLVMSLEGDELRSHVSHQFIDLDLIDVCHLSSAQWPLAAAGLASDGTVVLARDALAGRFGSLRIDGLDGTAYTLLTMDGHFAILTSKKLVLIRDIARRFLADEPMENGVEIREFPIQAIDAYAAYGRIHLVLPDEVESLDVTQAIQGEPCPPAVGFSEVPDHGPVDQPRLEIKYPRFIPLNAGASTLSHFTLTPVS